MNINYQNNNKNAFFAVPKLKVTTNDKIRSCGIKNLGLFNLLLHNKLN